MHEETGFHGEWGLIFLFKSGGAAVTIATAVNGATPRARIALLERLGLYGGNVAGNTLANAVCQFLTVRVRGDELAFLRVGCETALKQHRRAGNGAEYREARTLNTAVYGTCVADSTAVYGCGQGNVGTVLVVAGKRLSPACAGKGRCCAMRCQGKSLNALGRSATGVVVYAYK